MNIFHYKLFTYLLIFNCIHSSFTEDIASISSRITLKAEGDENVGEPLLLSPYLEKDEIALAQNLTRVSITEEMGIISHAGFFNVDCKYNSNLYFWYFPTFSKNEDDPVVLWISGGPGDSSLLGLLTENGPLLVKDGKFVKRELHWALNNHLIFIDSPVGTGFSFTDNDQGYCNDEDCIAKNLYNCLQQFFKLFPKLRNNSFFITGESYAGKYIPTLAMEIHKGNENQKKINLKGLAISSGYCDPVNQLDYGNYLYEHGLIDDNQRKNFLREQAKITREVNKQNWPLANELLDRLLIGFTTKPTYFNNYTGFDFYYNLLDTKEPDLYTFTDLLNSDEVRRSIHVGSLLFHSGQNNSTVVEHLSNDVAKSVAPLVSDLLSHYRIMFFNGQLDIVVAYPLAVNFLQKLNFTSSEEYKRAPRHKWKVGSDLAGYYKKAGNLTEVLVRNAGHLIPIDQPKWTYDLVTKFINNEI